MRFRRFLPLLAPALVAKARAADATANGVLLTMQDYFVIFVIAILYLVIFMLVAERIFRYQPPPSIRQRNLAIYVVGNIIAFMFIAAGNLIIISAVIILVAIAAQVEMLAWVADIFLANGIPLVGGILVAGAIGLFLYLVGLYLVIHMQGNPFMDKKGVPTRMSVPTKHRIDLMDEEPLNPTITFRVLDRDSDDPVVDAKVILKEMNGTRFYERFTDFNGEVTFQKIDGYGSQYYAYVEGDEKREKYRVIRRKVSAET